MFDVLLDEVPPVGSNIPTGSSENSWLFVLPTLAPDHALCLGPATPQLRAQLEANARTVTFVDGLAGREGGDPRPVDLLVAAGAAFERITAIDAELAELRRLLADGAHLVVHTLGARSEDVASQLARLVDIPTHPLTLDPAAGQGDGSAPVSGNVLFITGQLPANAGPVLVRRFRKLFILLSSRVARTLGRNNPTTAARVHASDLRPMRPIHAEQGKRSQAILVGPPGAELGRPPRWVRDLCRQAGLEVANDRWAFAPPRGYRSQKPLFLLHDTDGAPFVLKLTQEPEFNGRLLNEASALTTIVEQRLVDPASVPQVRFAGSYGGLAVVLETAWEGQPFRALSTADPTCPFAARAVEWFTALGERSAVPARNNDALHRGATRLVERYVDTFAPPAGHLAGLTSALKRLRGRAAPTVFYHGDPGNWNLMSRADGSIGVLDWENAKPAGPPGWDLLLFLKTFGTFVAEASGYRYTSSTFAEQFAPGSPMRELIDPSLLAYARRIRVEVDVLEVLILLCWVHQALKDASRLTSGTLASSHYRQVTEHCLENPVLLTARDSSR